MKKTIILNESQLRSFIIENASDDIEKKLEDVNIDPTEGQKKAGNYKMGHITFGGYKITIENPKGSYRKWTNEDGTTGKKKMNNHYGYFSNTRGKDNDQIDVFLGPYEDFDIVYVVDQNNSNKEFDESKVMLGFKTKSAAKNAYFSNFKKDWKGFRGITGVPKEVFSKWLYDGMKQQKPFAEYYDIQKKEIKESKEKSGLDKFFEKHGIKPLKDSIGFSEKEQKWYGWSHRAIYGFGIGSKVKKGDCAYNGKEWTAKTLEDAKQMAKDFQKGVD